MSLLSAVSDLFKPAQPLDPALSRALDRVAELVDPLLKLAPDFEKRLALPVQHALGYCEGLIAALPGPVDINRQAFGKDPLIHALFATADDIDQMLGRSQAIRDYLAEPRSLESDYFYAMFAARRQQKKQLGLAQEGDVIRNDVPQLVLYFSGQTLIEPSLDLDETRHLLRCKALESLLHTFRTHVESLRRERDGLLADASMERAHLIARHRDISGEVQEIHTRHLAELDRELRGKASSLAPEQLVHALADYLMAPEAALHLTPVSITVDRMGVVHDHGDELADNVDTLNFPELTARDRRLHLAMLARISRDEALEAVERVRDQQHRFMLI